ncbi:MAG: hypothetical protein ACI8ZN_000669 [Bacteroidia bacterium]|jgi:hypothetical protein
MSRIRFHHLLLCFGALLFGVNTALAQDGKVVILNNERVDEQVNQKVSNNDTIVLTGYRIQLYFGSDREDAMKMKQKFLSIYPELAVSAYVDYFQPSWKLRVGNYYRKIDAQAFMMELQSHFDSVFLVRDKIELPQLIVKEQE